MLSVLRPHDWFSSTQASLLLFSEWPSFTAMTIKELPAPQSLTYLQDFLNQNKNRPSIRDIPSLNNRLLKRARNCIRFSVDNNDLLEFIGDRAVNLVTALLVEKVKLSKSHHTVRNRLHVLKRSTYSLLEGRSQGCLQQ